MPTWSPGPTPWAARWWASRFARSSIPLYVRRLPSQTTYSRSPKWSAAFSKRSARLNSTTPRLEHVLIGRQVWHSGGVVGQDDRFEVADIEFDAEGATLRGWLYRPRSVASDAPVVVMAHGYNCLKEFYLDQYAASVASAGHVVLAYDHRNFGESEGEPRQELDPWVQV